MISVPIIITIYIGFIYLTYNPLYNYIFYDTKEQKYGIDEYKNSKINIKTDILKDKQEKIKKKLVI